MPHKTKKESKKNQPEGSRWHNFHFSGKLILCSVFFGLMLLLIGGIIMAIGMDRDDETKTGDLNDAQKKPPLVIVGPVVMGIGGFITCVGIIMCLVETRVCRSKSADSNPLIVGSEEEDSGNRDSETLVKELETSPRSQRHHRKHRHGHKKIVGNEIGNPKSYKSAQVNISPTSSSSGPISIASKSYLTSSETFMTPPSTLTHGAIQMSSRDAENQTSTSLITSFNNSGKSWNVSTDFQTPSTSFNDTLSFECSQEINDVQEESNDYCLQSDALEKQHQFVTPQNSDAEKVAPSSNITEPKSSGEIPFFANSDMPSNSIQESLDTPKSNQAQVPASMEVFGGAQSTHFMKQTGKDFVTIEEYKSNLDNHLKSEEEFLHESETKQNESQPQSNVKSSVFDECPNATTAESSDETRNTLHKNEDKIHQLMTEQTSESLNEKEFHAASIDVQQDVEENIATLNPDDRKGDEINSNKSIKIMRETISHDPND